MLTRSRAVLLAGAAIALGLFSRKVPLGFFLWDKSLGDALYAVMVFAFVAFVRPNARPRSIGIVAFAICFGLELFQLTGIPKTLPRILRTAIGDTFAWHDVLCYAAGAVLAVFVTERFTRSGAHAI